MQDCPKFSPNGARNNKNSVSKCKNYKISKPSSDGYQNVFNKINKGKSPSGENNGIFNVKVSNRYQALQNTIPQVWQPRGGRNGGDAWVPKTQNNKSPNQGNNAGKGENGISNKK
ncbi:unnamed protein product, partial [Rotaria magnacalcarata]